MNVTRSSYVLDFIGNKLPSSIRHLACAACRPEVMQSTGDLHHKISRLIPRVAKHILDIDNTTPFDPTYHMLNDNAHTGDQGILLFLRLSQLPTPMLLLSTTLSFSVFGLNSA